MPESWNWDSEFYYQSDWPVMKGLIQLPPGMQVELYNDTAQRPMQMVCVYRTTDSNNPLDSAVIRTQRSMYMDTYPRRAVLEFVKNVVWELWDHELREWCRFGDEFMFGDPHA